MNEYDSLLKEILDKGVSRTNKRTNIKTLSLFGVMKRYNLESEYFPIVSRRKVWPKSVFAELLWFLSGNTNNEDLKKFGCNFWSPWVSEEFERKNDFVPNSFGPVYGFQLRYFGGDYNRGIHNEDYGKGGHDQLAWIINRIKEDPSCRRIMWSLWNPADLRQMRLPPCHWAYQIMIDDDRNLTGMLIMRSVDAPVGKIANVQFYAALTKMIAQQTDCHARELVFTGGDVHIYEDQVEAVKKYLETPIVNSPKLDIKKAKDIFSYSLENFVISEYTPGPKIDIPVAV